MPGNEIKICSFLFSNLGIINLKHIGILWEIGAPTNNPQGFIIIQNLNQIEKISTSDSYKKADVYLNRSGVSFKQKGGSNLYNRLQRADILKICSTLGFSNPDVKLARIDKEVNKFQEGITQNRNRPWEDFLSEVEFREMLHFLMLVGSHNHGISAHPAQFILEAPASKINQNNILIYSFDEYFDAYRQQIKISIRRSFIGQKSSTEHQRAVGLAKKPGNFPWVYKEISEIVSKRIQWNEAIPSSERRAVYYLMIEKLLK